MLMQSSPCSVEAAISFVTDDRKQGLLCDWVPRAETWKTGVKLEDLSRGCCKDSNLTEEGTDEGSDSSLDHYSCCKISSVSNMSTSSAQNLVYKRRKMVDISTSLFSSQETNIRKEDSGCLSNMSSKDDGFDQRKNRTSSIGISAVSTGLCNSEHIFNGSGSSSGQRHCQKLDCAPCTTAEKTDCVLAMSKSESLSKCQDGEERHFDEAHNSRSAVSTGLCNSEHICNRSESSSGLRHCQKLEGAPHTNEEKTDHVLAMSKSESLNKCPDGEEQLSDEAHDSKTAFEYCKDNDSVSSSKSKKELHSISLNIDVDDNVECSSSEVLLEKNISAKELCISILENHGLFKRSVTDRTSASANCMSINDENTCSQLCKACGQKETSLKMLICDNCEDAYHVTCCNPKVRRIPIHEWHCQPCSRKKMKLKVEASTKKSSKIKNETSECKVRASKSGWGPIQLMLEDCEPYATNVRIGNSFQADIPEWRGPNFEEYDCFGEPSEVEVKECGTFDEMNTRNTNRSTPTVGNWLQCRQVIDDTDNKICGKYRRAPLFEVQTDDWDCSCSVLWDPIHSDCAVPQELDTDQVLVHLKYIQLLRPRLACKKRKPSS